MISQLYCNIYTTTSTVSLRTTEFGTTTQVGERRVSVGKMEPRAFHLKGRGPSVLNFWDLTTYAHTVWEATVNQSINIRLIKVVKRNLKQLKYWQC